MTEKNVSYPINHAFLSRTLLLIAEILGIVLIAATVGAGVLYWRLTQGPINLALIKPQLESALARARDGQPVTMNSVTLEWSQDRARVEIAMSDVALHGADNRTDAIATAKNASVILRAGALLFGRIEPLHLRLENGDARMTDAQATTNAISELPQVLADLRTLMFTYTLDRLELSAFTVSPAAQSNQNWSIRDVSAIIGKKGQALTISVQGHVVAPSEPPAEPVIVTADLTVDPDGSSRSERIDIANTSLATVQSLLLPRMPTPGFDGLARIGLSFSASPDMIDAIGLELKAKDGTLIVPGLNGDRASIPVKALDMDISYVPASRTLTVSDLIIESDPLSGQLSATMEIGPQVDTSRPFLRDAVIDIDAAELRVNIPQLVSDPATLASARIVGRFGAADRAMNLTEVRIVHSDGFTFGGFVRAVWPKDNSSEPVQVTASLSGAETTSGGLTVRQGVGLIPAGVAGGFRAWVDHHIHGGDITSMTLTLNCSQGLVLAAAGCVALDMAYAGVALHDIGVLPPVTGIAGRASVRDGSFTARIEAGQVESWTIESGHFQSLLAPQSGPDAQQRIDIDVNGPLSDLRSILGPIFPADCQPANQRRPTAGVGRANVVIEIYELDRGGNELDVSINGKLMQASRHNIVPEMHLTGANLDLSVRNHEVRISGSGLFDGSRAMLDWTNNGDDKQRISVPGGQTRQDATQPPSTLNVRMSLDVEQLRQIGLSASLDGALQSGRTAIDLTLDSRACQTDVAVARLDLSDNVLRLPFPGWIKEKGEPASGAVRYGRNPGGDSVVTVDLRASGLSLVADMSLHPGGELNLLSIERAYARQDVDISGRVRPADDRGYVIDLKGSVFDAGSFVDQFRTGRFGQSGSIPIEVSIDVLSLTKDREEFLRDARVYVKSDANGLQTARMSGRISSRGVLKFALDTIESRAPAVQDDSDTDTHTHVPQTQQEKRIKLRSDDAGRVMKIFTGRDILREGEIAATAEVGPDRSTLLIRVHEGKVRNLPILARVLSLASLSGLAAAQSNEGIVFTNIEIPIRISPERTDILNARASGPALGITASGWVINQTGELSLTGYIVPSFGINAALGGIPIIGDLFVSRSGEGVFAISYAISGTLDEAEARVTPLSLLTPGILRRAFENAPPPPTLASRARQDTNSDQISDPSASGNADSSPDPADSPKAERSATSADLVAPSRKPSRP